MCEGHYDILTEEGPRGDTVFIPAEGPELDALAYSLRNVVLTAFLVEKKSGAETARAVLEALRGK